MSAEKEVLIVDDDPMIRHIVTTVLKSAGYTTQTAASGAEGLEKIRALTATNNLPPFLFLDLQLVDTNGAELIEQIRPIYAGKSVRFIVLSAHSAEEAQQQFPNLSYDVFLRKPFQPQEIIAAVS